MIRSLRAVFENLGPLNKRHHSGAHQASLVLAVENSDLRFRDMAIILAAARRHVGKARHRLLMAHFKKKDRAKHAPCH